MLWSKLSEYWIFDEGCGTLEDDGFICFTPKEDYIIEIEDEFGEIYVTDYMQIVRSDDMSERFVFQVIADSENPINILIKTYANDTIITAKVYKKIAVDI